MQPYWVERRWSWSKNFPRLEKLRITDCPLLQSTPTQFEILRELIIERVDSEMTLLNLCNNLTSLVDHTVDHVKELTCVPNEMLRNKISLQFLLVSECGEFRDLPQSLYNLKTFRIFDCPNLTSLHVPNRENCLYSPEAMYVLVCKNLVSLPLHVGEMPSLSSLCISDCSKLISLPSGGLYRLIGLMDLGIGPFSETVDFEAFQLIFNGIQQLLSLRRLNLGDTCTGILCLISLFNPGP